MPSREESDAGTTHPYGSGDWTLIEVGWTDEERQDLYAVEEGDDE